MLNGQRVIAAVAEGVALTEHASIEGQRSANGTEPPSPGAADDIDLENGSPWQTFLLGAFSSWIAARVRSSGDSGAMVQTLNRITAKSRTFF